MNRPFPFLLLATFVSVLEILSFAGLTAADDAAKVKAIFADPPRQYSSGPLWTWNDMLTEEQIRSTLRDLAGQKVKQVWVHPRPGLMTTYLSDDWFRLWKIALDEAQRLDMNIWIYDEDSWPKPRWSTISAARTSSSGTVRSKGPNLSSGSVVIAPLSCHR